MPVQNAEIAAMFDQTADLLEIKGENQFRVRAYRRAARTVEGLPQSVRGMLAAQADLSDLPGIGKDLAGKIAAICACRHFDLLDQLKKQLPGELGEMAALPGLGLRAMCLGHGFSSMHTCLVPGRPHDDRRSRISADDLC